METFYCIMLPEKLRDFELWFYGCREAFSHDNVMKARVVKGYMRDPGQQGDGDDIHTLLPPPYRLGAVDTHLISPVFLPFDIAKDRKITDNIYQNPDSCVL